MTDQLTFTAEELLADHEVVEPLFAMGRRCHGGFDAEGNYRSPRTLHRAPAIDAWQSQHERSFGTTILDIELESFPGNYPNVGQTRFLLRHGVREPMIANLTRIGTVEGFGAFLRYSIVPDLQRFFDESIEGTATAHLEHGLIEAHARDEAGFDQEAGHNEMWFAARDIAFESPVTEDETQRMLQRMGITRPGGSVDLAQMRAQAMANRVLPDDIDFDLESLLERLCRLLLIEITAFHSFRWAEEVLDDRELVAGDGEAARLVSYIRADETPHVAYLRTTLSEMRDRTFVGDGGRRHRGTDLVGAIWERAVADQRGARRSEFLEVIHTEVERVLALRPDGRDLLEEFDRLGTVTRTADGRWVDRPLAA